METMFISNYGRLDKRSRVFLTFEEAQATNCRYIEEFRNGKYFTTYELTNTVLGDRYEDINID